MLCTFLKPSQLQVELARFTPHQNRYPFRNSHTKLFEPTLYPFDDSLHLPGKISLHAVCQNACRPAVPAIESWELDPVSWIFTTEQAQKDPIQEDLDFLQTGREGLANSLPFLKAVHASKSTPAMSDLGSLFAEMHSSQKEIEERSLRELSHNMADTSH